jgi:glycosyltransferase involved in cell wall biosynthesis
MTTPQKHRPTIPSIESDYGKRKAKLLYVSHLPRRPSGGGMLAVSFRIAQQLDHYFDLQDIGPIVPHVSVMDALLSKIRRKVFDVPGRFYQFSANTLAATARQIEEHIGDETDAVFFRSLTRWIDCRPTVPYYVHTDVVFHTFFHNTFDPTDFSTSDLQRIWDEERKFLEGAAAVFFESEWGLQKARSAYQLTGNNFIALRNGGGIEPPDCDAWDGHSLRLVSIAKHFQQKGGDIVLEAFRMLKPRYPELQWHIIGGPPEGDLEGIDGIHYEGFLRTDVPAELIRFREMLANAFLLVHPTREDTNPLVLIEAAYFGCPSVSVDDFAIPELVVNGETGVLLKRPITGESLADAIENLILERNLYLDLRRKARVRAVQQFQWDAIGDEMASHIRRCLVQSPR